MINLNWLRKLSLGLLIASSMVTLSATARPHQCDRSYGGYLDFYAATAVEDKSDPCRSYIICKYKDSYNQKNQTNSPLSAKPRGWSDTCVKSNPFECPFDYACHP